MNSPLISVIIPCYNSSKFLKDTLGSLLAQTYQHWEAIFVDDGSTDDTIEIIKSIQDERIKVYCKTPEGLPCKSRMYGSRFAQGEYLVFWDHDDYSHPRRFESQISAFLAHPQAGAVYTDRIVVNTETFASREFVEDIKPPQILAPEELYKGNPVTWSSGMTKTTVFKAVDGLSTNREMIGVDDYHFWPKISLIKEIYFIPSPLTFYRVHGNNLGIDQSIFIPGLQSTLDYFLKKPDSPPKLIAYLRHQIAKSSGVLAIPESPFRAVKLIVESLRYRCPPKTLTILAYALLNFFMPYVVRKKLFMKLHRY
ncbi:MAG: glycosyltransferase family 2 protein [Oligoflexales bacterium]|nr:glycosyltransferase family 2 protein [Oligoflexales bacterium]